MKLISWFLVNVKIDTSIHTSIQSPPPSPYPEMSSLLPLLPTNFPPLPSSPIPLFPPPSQLPLPLYLPLFPSPLLPPHLLPDYTIVTDTFW